MAVVQTEKCIISVNGRCFNLWLYIMMGWGGARFCRLPGGKIELKKR